MFFFHDGGSSEISTSLRLSKKYVQVFPQMKNIKNSEEVLSIKKDVYFTVPMRDVKGCDLFDIPGVERAEIHCSMEPECVGFVTYGNRAYLKNCLGDRVVETLDQHFVLSVKEKHALEISNPSSVETNQRKKLNENRVFWLHIPKTGTSFFNTVFHWACPRTVSLFYLSSHAHYTHTHTHQVSRQRRQL